MTFAERLKYLREGQRPKIYQKELAEAIGVSRQAITMWEIGQRIPDAVTLDRLAHFFGTSVDYLLGRTDDPADPNEVAAKTISEAISDDPELLEFWKELSRREDLQLLFKQVKPMTPKGIKKIIKVIKAIEDEEAQE